MFSTFLMVVLTQVIPCMPGEMSAVCTCKAGVVSVCAALVAEDTEKAGKLLEQVEAFLEALNALEMAGKASDRDKDQKKQLQKIVVALGGETSEPPNCNGQEHHLISRRIAERLQKHSALKGLFKPRDSRYVARAKDEQAHCGYQDWHRNVDNEIIDWLEKNAEATPEAFMDKLREVYNRPAMKARFPNGF